MSTKAKKTTAARGLDVIVKTGESLRSGWHNLKEAVRTRNGQYLILAAQFLLSFLSLLYFKGVLRLAYYSMFYRLDIPEESKKTYCFLVTLVCIFFGAVMLFTRRQIVTRVVIMCAMPFYLPIILFNYQHLVLLVPLMIMVVITFLASGSGEGVKTILGAVFLSLYILGAFVFMTVQSLLRPAIEETVIKRDVTPKGAFRYSVVQVLDQGNGNTYVSIEPNTADIDYSHSKWYAKGFAKEVYQERPLSEKFKIEWKTQTRSEITRELITHNPSTVFTLDAEQIKLLGLDAGYQKEFTIGELSRRQRHKLGYGSNDDKIDSKLARLLRITLKDPEETVTLNFEQMIDLGLSPTYEQRLSRMTDENLATLGVPEENEVLYVNGKVVFRQYVAVLERTFSESSRDLSAFLESNTVPEVHPEGVEIPKTETTTTTVTTTTTTTEETTTTTEEPQWQWQQQWW
ncbi:MAG TPA: hypothetical protein DCP68_09170 [Ruminococcus sp.]|nr:hypothetical protein [Ruminococcus sp.]